MNIVIFGPPGAGKGTQADKITDNFNLYKISTGNLLRDEIKNNTILGKQIKTTVDSGLFVSDEIIGNLIAKVLSNKKYYNQWVFDGYPRNFDQARNLDVLLKEYKQKISCVLSLNVNKELVVKRILGRQTCEKCGSIFNEYYYPSTKKNHSCDSKFLKKRKDDNEKIIVNRFETYLEKTLPILDFYKKQNLLYQIDGAAEIDVIYKEIQGIIATLEA